MRVLTTGFGPFLSVKENPSQWLVEQSGAPHVVLPVSFSAVDTFVDELDPTSFDSLVMVGVHGKARKIHLETTARNKVGVTPDVEGKVLGPGDIVAGGPPIVRHRLWNEVWWDEARADFTLTNHAGSYLCNYIFYSAALRFPQKRVGFVHVPNWKAMSSERQTWAFATLLSRLEGLT